jgi:hypothetical protein
MKNILNRITLILVLLLCFCGIFTNIAGILGGRFIFIPLLVFSSLGFISSIILLIGKTNKTEEWEFWG